MTFSTVSPGSTGGGIVRGDGKWAESGTTPAETQRMQKVFESTQQSAPSASVRVAPSMPGRTPVTSFIKDGKVTIGTFSFTLEVPFAENQGIIQVLSEMNEDALKKLCGELQKELYKYNKLLIRDPAQSRPYKSNLEVARAWYHRRFEAMELLKECKQMTWYLPYTELIPARSVDMDWLATNPSIRGQFLACFDESITKLDDAVDLLQTPFVDEQEAEKLLQAEAISVESFRGKLNEKDPQLDKNFALILEYGTSKKFEELGKLMEQVGTKAKRGISSLIDKRAEKYAAWLRLRTDLKGSVEGMCFTKDSVIHTFLRVCSDPRFYNDPEILYIRKHASDESRKLLCESFSALRAVVQENKAHFEGLKQPRLF